MTNRIMSFILSLFFFAISQVAFSLSPDGETSFLFFGDWGTGTSEQYEVAAAMKQYCSNERCEFALSLGDNFYPSGVANVSDKQFDEKFLKAYKPLQIPFLVVLGNHDYEGNIQAQIDYSKVNPIWHLPSRFYKKTQGAIDFFALDTENFDGAQQAWLKNELKASQATWKIAFGHHPIFSYGSHGNSDHLIKNLLPILKGNVSFYLAGHDHDLQVISKDGLQTIISGAAAKLRPTQQGVNSLYAASELGFSHFRISDSNALLRMIGKNQSILFEKRYSRLEMESTGRLN